MQGKPIQQVIPGRSVRTATESDVESCNAVCIAVHGHDRNGELRDSIKQGSAKVVLHGDRITGYTSGLAYFNHSVGLANDDLKALIASATADFQDVISKLPRDWLHTISVRRHAMATCNECRL
jgi:hypothetical protein